MDSNVEEEHEEEHEDSKKERKARTTKIEPVIIPKNYKTTNMI
jgi:hypothetical protein